MWSTARLGTGFLAFHTWMVLLRILHENMNRDDRESCIDIRKAQGGISGRIYICWAIVLLPSSNQKFSYQERLPFLLYPDCKGVGKIG